MKSAHIIWDWNGTLLNDVHISLFAANAAISELGYQPITLEMYKKTYRVPVKKFYENILQHPPTEQEWNTIGRVFNKHYIPMVKKALVVDNALNILESRRGMNASQSLCSLMEHSDLMQSIHFNKVGEYFSHISGRDEPLLKTGKELQLINHIKKLNIAPEQCVIIGDAADDALAAYAAGAKAVLYSGGTHCKESLKMTNAPVVSSLEEALAITDQLI